jgi:hypothetical protein
MSAAPTDMNVVEMATPGGPSVLVAARGQRRAQVKEKCLVVGAGVNGTDPMQRRDL